MAEVSDTSNYDTLNGEIKELEKVLRNYEQRRVNLLEAMELGEFGTDEILDWLNNIKRLRTENEIKINDLRQTIDNLTNLADAKVKMDQLYEQVITNIENSSHETKRLALDALDIKVYASTDAVEIKGIIPLELALPTTERTLGCLIVLYYDDSSGNEALSILPFTNHIMASCKAVIEVIVST